MADSSLLANQILELFWVCLYFKSCSFFILFLFLEKSALRLVIPFFSQLRNMLLNVVIVQPPIVSSIKSTFIRKLLNISLILTFVNDTVLLRTLTSYLFGALFLHGLPIQHSSRLRVVVLSVKDNCLLHKFVIHDLCGARRLISSLVVMRGQIWSFVDKLRRFKLVGDH